MTIRVYGDVTIDNYAFEWPGDFRPTYKRRHGIPEEKDLVPGLEGIRSRFVARQFGGAYLLARNIAVAFALWNTGSDRETVLSEREPWKKYYDETLKPMREDITKDPNKFDNIINFFHGIAKNPDEAYRVSLNGREGFTLPNNKSSEHLFRCLIDSNHKDEACRPIEIEPVESEVTLCLFNAGGTRLLEEDPGWLGKESWWKQFDRTWAVVKTHDPNQRKGLDGKSDFARFFEKLKEGVGQNILLVLKADDLRRNKMPIRHSLSWERSIRDVVAGIKKGEVLGHRLPPHLVVVFDFDAALYLNIKTEGGCAAVSQGIFVFSTDRGEGEFQSLFSGTLPGAQSTFTSVLSGLIYSHISKKKDVSILDDSDIIERVLTFALIAKQKMLEAGLEPIIDDNLAGEDPKHRPEPPRVTYFEAAFALPAMENAKTRGRVENMRPDPQMPQSHKLDVFVDPLKRDEAGQNKQLRKDQAARRLSAIKLTSEWLDNKSGTNDEFIDLLLPVAQDHQTLAKMLVHYVQEAKLDDDTPLPICTLGKIKTISGQEIEDLRSIRRLIESYLAREDDRTPLGVAVFGQPGSGKGFTLKSIVETLSPRGRDLPQNSLIECNLSGFSDPEDLTAYFQRARDIRLEGGVPILFFDEFDCTVGDEGEFFWLKYFLSPLQDGKFTSRHQTHPIGKSVFVFAGGVAHTFKDFASRVSAREALLKKFGSPSPLGKVATPDIKGADFLSRLHGHINIGGLNPEMDGSGVLDERLSDNKIRMLVLRRAIVLRDILKLRLGSIFSDKKEGAKADIHENVVKAFLFDDQFDHGVRSIEAIIRMSRVKNRFDPECLPPEEQLSMHVSPLFHKRAFGLSLSNS